MKFTSESTFSWFLQSQNICKSSHSIRDSLLSISATQRFNHFCFFKKAYFNFSWKTHLQNHHLPISTLKSKIYLKTQCEKIYPAPLKIKFLPAWELDKFWNYQQCCCIRTEPNSNYIAPGIWSIRNISGSKNWVLGNSLSSYIDTPDTMKILEGFVSKRKKNEQAKNPVHIKKKIIQMCNFEVE